MPPVEGKAGTYILEACMVFASNSIGYPVAFVSCKKIIVESVFQVLALELPPEPVTKVTFSCLGLVWASVRRTMGL